MKIKTRSYSMRTRAKATAETGRRILGAMERLLALRPYDQITLGAVASGAGVTLQTVLRRFGSKEALFTIGAADARARILTQRGAAPSGNLPEAVQNLFDHYEEWGAIVLRLLEQEEQIPRIARLVRAGRATHAAWVERVFAAALPRGRARARRRAQLIAATDVYVWKLFRRDLGMKRAEAERAVLEMVQAISM